MTRIAQYFDYQLGASAFTAIVVTVGIALQADAGLITGNRSVGGVAVDVDGVVSAPTVEDDQALEKVRQTALAEVPVDLQPFTELRAVSLKQIEAAIAKYRKEQLPIPDSVKCLAGLLRVQYVLVYPDREDIVLAGPAEGWRSDALGNVVGATTGRPVVLLDDLIVALRTRRSSRLEPISCSIDPTPEGLQRYQKLQRELRAIGNPQTTLRRIEEAVGPQVISITGVPASSRFARTMVAADFRMKRLAMDLEQAPIDDLPSFMQLRKGSRGSHSKNMMPRWWLAPKYDALVRDVEGLSWELRGQGVQCMTEQDYFDDQGERERTVKAGPLAIRWAETFTKRFSDLADHDSAFGHLRNVIDLAVIAALIEKEQLLIRAGIELPQLLQEEELKQFDVPRRVATQASFVKQRKNWVISASGGVKLLPWEIADRNETVEEVGEVHEKLSTDVDQWWWE